MAGGGAVVARTVDIEAEIRESDSLAEISVFGIGYSPQRA
jgi:hypothetical protein